MLRQRPTSPFERSPLGGIGGLLLALVVLYLLFRLAAFAFKLLWWAGPILFIVSLFIDHRVFLGYFNSIKRLFSRNWVLGLAAALLSLVAFPLVGVYCFGLAMFKRRVREARNQVDERVNGRWTEYEDITETETMDLEIPYEELPPPPEPQPRTTPPRRDPDPGKYDDLIQ